MVDAAAAVGGGGGPCRRRRRSSARRRAATPRCRSASPTSRAARPRRWSWNFGDGGTLDGPEPRPHLHQRRHLHGDPDREQRRRLRRRGQDQLHHGDRAGRHLRQPALRHGLRDRRAGPVLDDGSTTDRAASRSPRPTRPHGGTLPPAMDDSSNGGTYSPERGVAAPEPGRAGAGGPELLVEGFRRRDPHPGRRLLLRQRRQQLRQGPRPQRARATPTTSGTTSPSTSTRSARPTGSA